MLYLECGCRLIIPLNYSNKRIDCGIEQVSVSLSIFRFSAKEVVKEEESGEIGERERGGKTKGREREDETKRERE